MAGLTRRQQAQAGCNDARSLILAGTDEHRFGGKMPQRDMDLIRIILLHVEAQEPVTGPGGFFTNALVDEIAGGADNAGIVAHHFQLLINQDYLDEFQSGIIRGLTWAGSDFIDSIRDIEIWEKVKQDAVKVNGWTADLLIELAKAYLKQKLSEVTGIPL